MSQQIKSYIYLGYVIYKADAQAFSHLINTTTPRCSHYTLILYLKKLRPGETKDFYKGTQLMARVRAETGTQDSNHQLGGFFPSKLQLRKGKKKKRERGERS